MISFLQTLRYFIYSSTPVGWRTRSETQNLRETSLASYFENPLEGEPSTLSISIAPTQFQITICCQAAETLTVVSLVWLVQTTNKNYPPTFFHSATKHSANPNDHPTTTTSSSSFVSTMMNAAAPALRMEEPSSTFKPIDLSSSADSCSLLEEPLLSPLAIFRDGENGATGMHLMQRANPIDSMDCSQNETSRHEEDDDDILWTDSHQRVISPFPVEPCDLPSTDSWKESPVDFSHFFPSATAGVMECDDFSLSSADGDVDDLVLADDLTNPESFWESGSHVTDSRSPSPAQVSVGTAASSSSNSLFPPSPTSTTQVHEFVDLTKTRLMPY